MEGKQFFSEQIILESKNLALRRAEMHRLYSVEDGKAGTLRRAAWHQSCTVNIPVAHVWTVAFSSLIKILR